MKRNFIFPAIVLIALFLVVRRSVVTTPLETITGSGRAVQTTRDITGFSSIQVNLGADLVLLQRGTESVTIQADDNLMPYIRTENQNGMLVISTPDGIQPVPLQPIQVWVSFDTLTAINVAGKSNIVADQLELDELALHFSGSGSTRFTGSAGKQSITIQGQATIHNFDFISHEVTVDVSGNGTIELNAEDTLNVTVNGLGIIRYTGHPIINRNISGIAHIASYDD